MLQQYFRIREEHPGVLLAMRVGDFYEFYGEDAEVAAASLEITLTGREDGPNGRIPMAGVPFHSVDKYLAKLVQKGHRVALCDQLEDPRQAKGLVKRGVTRVLTPGTVLEDSMLSRELSNYLVAICEKSGRSGLAVLEPTSGEFAVLELEGEAEERLLHELGRLKPTELLFTKEVRPLAELAQSHLGASIAEMEAPAERRAETALVDLLGTRNLQGFGLQGQEACVQAAAMILDFARRNHLVLDHVEGLTRYSLDQFMTLDLATRRSLELTSNLADGSRRFTLLESIDSTVTPMGARLLRRWIEQPLLDRTAILSRLEAVERLVESSLVRGDLREGLKRVSDLERLTTRSVAGLATPRDLGALRSSLAHLPKLEEPLRKVGLGRIQSLREEMHDLRELAHELERALVEDPPPHTREGGVIREGFDDELDTLRGLRSQGKSFIAALEAQERENTGIATLKVGYNAVFGYYLEVSKQHLAKIPEHYIRKQTTANAERFITAELKERESQVLGADEKALVLEQDLFIALRRRVAALSRELLATARALSELDVLLGLAETAVRRGFVKPELTEEGRLEIAGGRHPVVEAHTSKFVPNDLLFSEDGTRLAVLTGPNMSGKSTYLRQVALIVLLAQIGSFVPAQKCAWGICDRVFARIGAKDELALGQSTFMVEMVESANILNHATGRSLVILDEVGRGTSTYDGLAIAWAMVEHLAGVGAKTLFATHYHQLNQLAARDSRIANFRVAVEERGTELVWTHRVLPGGTDRSYGIHVARMAGLPNSVLRRADEVLGDLEGASPVTQVSQNRLQLSLFEVEPSVVEQELSHLEIERLTPLEALQLLDRWKRLHSGK